MKLERSKAQPETSTCRFVTDCNGKLLGGIGTVRDALDAGWISFKGSPRYGTTDMEKWAAFKTPSGWVKMFASRAEALAVFEGGYDEDVEAK